MKRPLATLTLALLFISVGALLASAEDRAASNHAYQSAASSPVPVEITQPKVFEREIGKTVKLRMKIDAQGNPHAVEAADRFNNDPGLTHRVIQAVETWKFEPARNAEGKAITQVVELPIRIKDMRRG